MNTKEQRAAEYADSIPQFDERKKYCIEDFCAGWDAALKSQWIKVEDRLPKENEKVFVLYEYKGSILIGTDTYFGEDFYKMYQISNTWNCGGEKIIAWMPIPSFEEILQANKDVLMRLKDM